MAAKRAMARGDSLQLTGLWEGFEGHVFSAEDVERGKPAPDLFLHAAAAMGYRPESCTVVEDSQLGSRLHGAVRTHNAGSPGAVIVGGQPGGALRRTT